MQLLLKVYLSGLAVLVIAVILNLLADWLRLATWYVFLDRVSQLGLAAALRSLNAVDGLFLLVLYPFLLGLAAYLVYSRL